ncbi:signal recognition particle receptor subunit alpha, partial [Thermodesulfobacteriota bacterium]
NRGEKRSIFDRLMHSLSKTRSGLIGRLDQLILGKKVIDEDLLEELEEILFTSDLGVNATQELIDLVRERVARKELDNPERLKEALKENITSFLDIPEVEFNGPAPGEPMIIMVIGVNGVGKTVHQSIKNTSLFTSIIDFTKHLYYHFFNQLLGLLHSNVN